MACFLMARAFSKSLLLLCPLTFFLASCSNSEKRALLNLTVENQNPPLPPAPAPHSSNSSSSFDALSALDDLPSVYRLTDGSSNNLSNPDWGKAGEALLRKTTVAYDNGTDSPAEGSKLNPREISNTVLSQSASLLNSKFASDMLWQWGQFLDHDLDLSPEASPVEAFDISVPLGDSFFDPFSTGTQTIPLNRSAFVTVGGIRQQTNLLTAFIDASNVYGSDDTRESALRSNDGSGKLRTSAGNLLPFNTFGLDNGDQGGTPSDFFVAGDVRANEQIGLIAMHTLFVREHNYWAETIKKRFPYYTGNEIFEKAKIIVTAEMQAITFNEFLPVLLSERAIPAYAGYRSDLNPGIANVFSTAAFRFGHTMLSGELLRLDADHAEIADGHISLADSFFNPDAIVNEGGIDPILRGLADQRAQEIDAKLVDEVRNFLFGPPGSGGLDLASLNIQRGREHGLATYNQTRIDYGLSAKTSFAEITSDPTLQAQLSAATGGDIDQLDVWVGALAEDDLDNSLVGELITVILRDQFIRLREGDRFWYQRYLSQELQELVEAQTLSVIIQRNTGIGDELDPNVFIAAGRAAP